MRSLSPNDLPPSRQALLRGILIGIVTLAILAVAVMRCPAQLMLDVQREGQDTVALTWPKVAGEVQLEETEQLEDGAVWQTVNEPTVDQGDAYSVLLPITNGQRFFRLQQLATTRPPAFSLVESLPSEGAREVGVTFRPNLVFTEPAVPGSINTNTFYASVAGKVIQSTVVSASDGGRAWLFFRQPMPGNSRVRVTVEGDGILRASDKEALDADGDGFPGGVLIYEFTTVSMTGAPGTTLSGLVVDPGPDLVPYTSDDFDAGADSLAGTDDDVYKLPIAGAHVYLNGLESQTVFTGADGTFRLTKVPAGNVKVLIDGQLSTSAPAGSYFPCMVMDAHMSVGVDNAVVPNTREVYLPRLARSILKPVSNNQTNVVMVDAEGAPNLTPEQREKLTITVLPNSMIAKSNSAPLSSGKIGISTVPSELVRDMLPAGVLQHTFDITVQAPGIALFTTPAPMTFPNVFNAAPGTQLNFLSFDHTTGRLVIEGTATVSADGLSVSTDPGTGITHPGWHGLTPPGGPNDPPCDPKAPHDVDRLPVVVTAGLQNQFFVTPEAKRLLFSFGNAAAKLVPGDNDPCSPANIRATPLVVDIKVEGNSQKDYFLKGLQPSEVKQFMLLPGQKQDIPWSLESMLDLNGNGQPDFKKIEKDRLHVAKVTVRAWQFNHPSSLLIDKEIYIALFLDAADADHGDGILSMANTAADGSGGVIRRRPLEVRGATVKLEVSDQAHFPALSQAKEVLFDPTSIGRALSSKLRVLAPNGTMIGELGLLGDGVMQEYSFDSSKILDELQKAADGAVSGLTEGQLAFLKAPRALDEIVSNVSIKVEAYLKPYSAGLRDMMEPTPNGIQFPVYNSAGASEPIQASTLARSASVDFCRTGIGCDVGEALNTFIQGVPGWSRAEAGYRLSKFLNNNPGGSIELYIDHFLTAKVPDGSPYIPSASDLTNAIAKAIPHEIGHALGLVHTFSKGRAAADDKWIIGSDGQPVPGYKEDIMAQGKPAAAPSFLITKPALSMALGLDYSSADIGKAIGYYDAFRHGSLKFGRFDAAVAPDDLNAIEITPSDRGVLLIYGPGAETDSGMVTDYSFGEVMFRSAGSDAVTVPFTFRNSGGKDLTLTSVEIADDDSESFSLASQIPAGTVILAQGSITVMVKLKPAAAGELSGTLHVEHDGESGSADIEMAGFGLGPDALINVRVDSTNVGGSVVGEALHLPQYLSAENLGEKELRISSITGTGGFSIAGLPVVPTAGSPLVLMKGETLSMGLTFQPDGKGLRRGKIKFASNDPETPVYEVDLSGTGTDANPIDALDYGDDYVAMDSPDFANGPVLRAVSEGGGEFEFFLPPAQRYHGVIFDPVSGLVAHLQGNTAASGQNTKLGVPVFLPSTAPDTDRDGLPDDAEFAIGSDPNVADTDGNGVDDFTEVMQGVNPLGGQVATTGIIATLPEPRVSSVSLGSPDPENVNTLHAYLSSDTGMTIVDVTKPTLPVVLSRFAASNVKDVSVDDSSQIAALAVDGAANDGVSSLLLLDIIDPVAPAFWNELPFPVTLAEVETIGGWAYAASNNNFDPVTVRSVNMLTGEVTQILSAPVTKLNCLRREANFLYLLGDGGKLVIVSTDSGRMTLRGSVSVVVPRDFNSRFSVAGGIAYLPAGVGYQTVDVSNPDAPRLVAAAQAPPGAPGELTGTTGSGLLLLGSTARSAQGGPALDLMNGADPLNTSAFLTRFPTPDVVNEVAIGSGVAFAVSRFAAPAGAFETGLMLVLNYQGRDTGGQAPVISDIQILPDAESATAGFQVNPGETFFVRARLVDDRQVRQVELLVNGRVVQRSATPPYNLTGIAPTDSGEMTIQVRATDTGGNATLSDPIVARMVPDTEIPRLLSSDPPDGGTAPRGLRQARLRFSERMSPSAARPENFRLLRGDGSPLPVLSAGASERDFAIDVGFDRLEAGAYQLILPASAIRDASGNALGAGDIVINFTVDTYSIRWIKQSLGLWSWSNPENWSPKRMPNAEDTVRIQVNDRFELRLMSVAGVGDLPATGRSLLIVALVGEILHVRLFDSDAGKRDLSETSMAPGLNLDYLKELVRRIPVPDAAGFDPQTRQDIITKATLLTGFAPRVSIRPRFDGVIQDFRVRKLESNAKLELFSARFRAEESIRVDNELSLSASKVSDTLMLGAPNAIIVAGGVFVGPDQLIASLDRVRMEGDFRVRGFLNIVNTLTLNGTLSGTGTNNTNIAESTLQFYHTGGVSGKATIKNVQALIVGSPVFSRDVVVILGKDITWRGNLSFNMEGEEGVKLINQGTIIAEQSVFSSPSVRGGSHISISGRRGTGHSFVNEGIFEVRSGDRAQFSSVPGSPFINHGTLRVTDGSFLQMNGELTSHKTICDPGSYFSLGGAVVTESGAVSELSGGGLWIASAFAGGGELRGGTVRMTDGAVLEGGPEFNNVTFEGEVHWFPTTRNAELPPYLPNDRGGPMIVRGNLTLNGLIATRQKPEESGAVIEFAASGPVRLDGKGRILLAPGLSPSYVGGIGQDITFGPDITVEAHKAILGPIFIGSLPVFRNLGTILVDQPGDSLQVTAALMTNGGTMRIGPNVAVTIDRGFTQSSTGKLVFLASGTAPGVSHGQFKIGTAAGLDGTLTLEPVAPFQPSLGNVFRVLTYATRQGTFSTLQTPAAPAGTVWKSDYQTTGLELRVSAP